MPWWAWVLIVGAAAVPACGFVSAIAVYGVRKYVVNAKSAEARAVLPRLSAGIARCASEAGEGGTPRGLPPSSNGVPASVPRAQKYQSAPADWSSEVAFQCAGFTLSEPQYFAYQWQATSATSGQAIAVADLDGDGVPERRFEQAVECTGSAPCNVGPLVER